MHIRVRRRTGKYYLLQTCCIFYVGNPISEAMREMGAVACGRGPAGRESAWRGRGGEVVLLRDVRDAGLARCHGGPIGLIIMYVNAIRSSECTKRQISSSCEQYSTLFGSIRNVFVDISFGAAGGRNI